MGKRVAAKVRDGSTWDETLSSGDRIHRAMLHRDSFHSIVGDGNRVRYGSRFAPSGGKDRPRLNTTLPPQTLEAIDTLAAAHGLQRNEVLTLALATIAGPCSDPAAAAHFAALAAAWEGFAKGVQAPADGRPRMPSHRPPKGERSMASGRLGPEHREQIRLLVAQGDAAPRGWQSALARTVPCDASAVSRMADKIRRGVA